MDDKLDVHLSFQGGGAKLISLLAVADAFYGAADGYDLRLSGVSGTSAGAIVAAIIATGRNPAEFRPKLKSLGEKYLEKLGSNAPMWKMVLNAYFGKKILSRKILKKFLHDLFSDENGKQEFVTFSDLKYPLSVFATSLTTGKPHIFYQGNVDLIEALTHSAAIPFIFHTFEDDSEMVDGGWINNLPMKHLEQGDALRHAIGVTFFQRDALEQPNTLKEYCLSLIGISIDAHVQDSRLLARPENIFEIITPTTTFDFQRALLEDLGDEIYNGHVERFDNFLHNYQKRRIEELASLSAKTFSVRLHDLYLALRKKQIIRVSYARYVFCSNSLKNRSKKSIDTCDVKIQMIVESEEAYAFGFQYRSEGEYIDLGNVLINVTRHDGTPVKCSAFPLSPEAINTTDDSNNFLVFFHTPLRKCEEYTISYQFRAIEILYDTAVELRDFTDRLEYTVENVDAVDRIDFLVHVPEERSAFELKQLAHPPQGASGAHVTGRELTSDELGAMHTYKQGFRLIGWRSENLSMSDFSGFSATDVLRSRQLGK